MLTWEACRETLQSNSSYLWCAKWTQILDKSKSNVQIYWLTVGNRLNKDCRELWCQDKQFEAKENLIFSLRLYSGQQGVGARQDGRGHLSETTFVSAETQHRQHSWKILLPVSLFLHYFSILTILPFYCWTRELPGVALVNISNE